MRVSLRGVSLFVSRMLLPFFCFLPPKFGRVLKPPSPPPLAHAFVQPVQYYKRQNNPRCRLTHELPAWDR